MLANGYKEYDHYNDVRCVCNNNLSIPQLQFAHQALFRSDLLGQLHGPDCAEISEFIHEYWVIRGFVAALGKCVPKERHLPNTFRPAARANSVKKCSMSFIPKWRKRRDGGAIPRMLKKQEGESLYIVQEVISIKLHVLDNTMNISKQTFGGSKETTGEK
ncbi:hypothetical protein GALMADRAFT_909147 [Galerina marginata CBS 339.88]|uniref:Uncharacterized protein n=1 Tax=Galerina marginata (strain CBS 339.88) TaxID=685588 RepID=A0A067SSN1_GALM3|nr:hypothetical protein GALMADRAFT_909147 [Galerina marginata CBS 339.88]